MYSQPAPLSSSHAQYLPTIVLILFSGLTYALGRLDLLAFYLPGTYLSWVYLRFFQLQPDSGGVHGDASEDFKVRVLACACSCKLMAAPTT